MSETPLPVHIIAGPTAGGKSAHALSLAQREGGIIINADSMQLYNGLPILTAQPSAEDKALVPHRLYDIIPVSKRITAMDWRTLALREIDEAHANGQVPIVTGGTGFYLKALMHGLSPIPEVPEEVRLLSQDLMDKLGTEEFFALLSSVDPDIAARIDRQNPQRLVRAYEVFAHTGKPMSYWQSLPPENPPERLAFQVTLILPDRDILYQRCDARFDAMIENGVLREVEEFDARILAGDIPFDCPLTHALGFRPLQSYLRGETDFETAVYLSKNETRHYAKRQVTWFKHQTAN